MGISHCFAAIFLSILSWIILIFVARMYIEKESGVAKGCVHSGLLFSSQRLIELASFCSKETNVFIENEFGHTYLSFLLL